jgi:hypothetical protein
MFITIIVGLADTLGFDSCVMALWSSFETTQILILGRKSQALESTPLGAGIHQNMLGAAVYTFPGDVVPDDGPYPMIWSRPSRYLLDGANQPREVSGILLDLDGSRF